VKSCLVVFATPAAQWSWRVTLADQATVRDALEAARAQSGSLDVPWEADVGIFGELCERSAVPLDGDRIEIYRPLKADPKESRRARARDRLVERDRAGAPPRSSDRKPER
jgi:putative ubiquitin-RnfH superfamily antitoxin RatB of RatAB toxin-antitoxin module